MKRLPLILILCLALSACATDEQTNSAVRGGAVGAVAGALISDQPVEGALVGGAIGAATGAVLADPNRRGDRGEYYHDRGRHEGEYRRHEDDGGYRYYHRHDDDEGDD
jgi:YMGG-like Gly-zipper